MIKMFCLALIGVVSASAPLCQAETPTPDSRSIELASLRQAARGGDAEAAFALGQAYDVGDGIPVSAESALTWYEQAADTHPMAALRYAQIALANDARAELTLKFDPIARLTFAADEGISEAQFVLAMLLQTGQHVDTDPARARALLEQAATDWIPATSALGRLNHESRDYDLAKAHFGIALEAGDAMAAAYLGYYAERGVGEPVDRKKALQLYERALGVDWAAAAAQRLRERQSSIVVFGFRVYGSYRKELREHFVELGIAQVGGEEYFDAFNVTDFVGGRPTILTVAYAPGTPEYVAELNYKFERIDKETTRALHDELKNKLQKKYGAPLSETRKQGAYTVTWQRGQTRIQLQVASRSQAATVTYQLAPFVGSLRNYVTARDRQKKGVIDDAL